MEEEINKLTEMGQQIRAAQDGGRGKEHHVNSAVIIREYQEWVTQSGILLSQYYDKGNDSYATFSRQVRNGNGYVLMHSFDIQFPIFQALSKQILQGKPPIKEHKKADIKYGRGNSPAIFISHAVKDKVIADTFFDVILQNGLNIPKEAVFCTSTEGLGIRKGEDWRMAIHKTMAHSKIIFLLITPHYKESEICLCEMGAAWMMDDALVLPYIIEPINYKSVGVIQEPIQIGKLLTEGGLDNIRDFIEEYGINHGKIDSERWTVKKHKFITDIQTHISANPFPAPLTRDEFSALQIENVRLQTNNVR